MPTALDTKMRSTAQRLIKKFGKDAEFVTHGVDFYDHDERKQVKSAKAEQVVKITPLVDYNKRLVGSAGIRLGDSKCFCAALDVEGKGFVPKRDMIVHVSIVSPPSFTHQSKFKRWQIVRVKELQSGEQPVVYELQLRSPT